MGSTTHKTYQVVPTILYYKQPVTKVGVTISKCICKKCSSHTFTGGCWSSGYETWLCKSPVRIPHKTVFYLLETTSMYFRFRP